MKKDDSNGSSFEIIDKKGTDMSSNSEKSGTLSTLSSQYSIASPGSISLSTGNLLSNVAPPSSIPDFTLWPSSVGSTPSEAIEIPSTASENITSQPQAIPFGPHSNTIVTAGPLIGSQFPTTQFSAAIPPNKGIPLEATQTRPSQPPEAEPLVGSGFLGLVKGALSSGVFTKMAEKAKSSVDSIITTLDPQMSEYIYSGGDLEITVATEEDEIIGGIREAVHSKFGKAWVNGIKLGLPPQKSQAIGFECGRKNAEEKIDYSFKFRKTPTVAVENILLKQDKNWYDVYLLVLTDVEKQITVQTFSQATPVPVEKFLENVADIDIENKLSEYLQAVPGWQEEVSGISRKDVIYMSAKVLMNLYKDRLSQIK